MKVILTQEVKNLGKRGTVVQVAEGYARNFLFPRGMAIEATKTNMTQLAHESAVEQAKKDKELERAKGIAQKLQEGTLNVAAKSGEGGRLFGSVTNKEIAEEITRQFGVDVDKRKVELSEPIKNLGTYEAVLKLHPQAQVKIKVQVSAV